MVARTSFGQWLKQRRKTTDITCEDLARRLGCAASTLYKIEANSRRPSKQMAELLAEYLDIPPDERPAFVHFARAEETVSAALWGASFHPQSNLTDQATLLIGREQDAAAVRKRLLQPSSRLLTLIGPPGIGKTRLALQVAAETLDDFVDGVFFISLAPITDADLVLTTVATTLGVLDLGPQTPLERLKVFLRDKETLLVLDNFEQILAAAPSIAELLIGCPWLKLLVTSRAPLRIRQERQIPVAPLAVPDLIHLPDVESVATYSAVRLFMERAQAVKSDFVLTQQTAPSVVALCARLDGLPLAIELISSRVKLFSPSALLERLHGRLMLQSDGLRDIEPRHRTLNAAIEWSYQLLSVEEQTLLRRLSVFVGGWTLDATGAVCLEHLNLSVFDGLASLLDKNLVKQETQSDDEPRFQMLETIREYALGQLAASGEESALQRQHADYFLALAETTHPPLTGVETGLWWDRLEVEHPNLRAALTWSRTQADRETELRLSLALVGFWHRRGHISEGSGWLADALTRTEGAARELPTATYHRLRAKALDALGTFMVFRGDLDSAQPLYEECLRLFQELEDSAGIAETLGDYGMLFVQSREYVRAEALLNESQVLWRELGSTGGMAGGFLFLGNLAYAQGQITQAGAAWEEGLALCRAENFTWNASILLTQLAMVTQEEGDYQRAGAQLTESLTILREMRERWQTAYTLEVFACLAAAQGPSSEDGQSSLRRSARLFGAAEILRETTASQVLTFLQDFNERGIASLRAQLDEASLKIAWAEGRAMTLDQVVAYALDDTPNRMTAMEQFDDAPPSGKL